jgi:hypothetical protein
LKLADVARARLRNQSLVDPRFSRTLDVVSYLGAVQAQDYAGAKWAVAQRTKTCKEADVEQAVNNGAIVRTHVLRPTWHFVAPADIRWMLELTGKRIKQVMSYSNRALGFDQSALKKSGRALVRSLRGGRSLIRSELYEILKTAGINVAGDQRLGHLLMDAELDGLICNGPRRGNHSTYALLEERVPAVDRIDRDEALLRLARIYFKSHGPATVADFSWWSGLTVAEAKRAVDIASDELDTIDIDGRAYFLSSISSAGRTDTAHLLPNYDESFIAYRDRSAVAERLRKSGFAGRTDNIFTHIAIVDGQVVGTWKRTSTRAGHRVEITPLVNLTASDNRKLRAATKRYSDYLGSSVDLVDKSLYQNS